MKKLNLITAGVTIFVALPLFFYFGKFVPGFRGPNGKLLSDNLLLNSYFIFWGFLLTSAWIGPIVAQVLASLANKEWRAARINARNRLADSINNIVNSYNTFLKSLMSEETEQYALNFLDQTLLYLVEFFDIHESEHASFNAGMHSAASNIRKQLLPFRRALESTSSAAHRKRSRRIYLSVNALNNLREFYDLPALASDSNLASNPYLVKNNEVFLDVRVDQQIGGGTTLIHRFGELNMEIIQNEWGEFCKARPGRTSPDIALKEVLAFDGVTQARLHAKFAKMHIEGFLADHFVKQ